jgi:hypothetical protein
MLLAAGGSAESSVTLYRGLGVAANLSGEHNSSIGAGVNLDKFSLMAGPRYTFQTARWTERYLGRTHESNVFAETLFGIARGFNGVFPTSTGVTSSADSVAAQIGGGFNVGVTRGLGIRALEIDYVHTGLPNNGSNSQNHLRLAIGASYHFKSLTRCGLQ